MSRDLDFKRAGGGIWDRVTAPFGRKNALDRLAEVIGLEREKTWTILWESNGRLRARMLRYWSSVATPESYKHVSAGYGELPAGVEAITCPRCHRTSYNANDVREGYCGACHAWTTPRPRA